MMISYHIMTALLNNYFLDRLINFNATVIIPNLMLLNVSNMKQTITDNKAFCFVSFHSCLLFRHMFRFYTNFSVIGVYWVNT